MRTNSTKKLLAALSMAGACAAAGAAGNLVLAPASSSVGLPEAFSLKVMGSAFTDDLVGGGFNVSFDASKLSLTSVTINTALWEFAPLTGTIDNVAGTLSGVAFNSFLNTPTGNFEAATLNFSSKAAGSSMVSLNASPTFPFANLAAEQVDVSFGSAQVTAVPEPATALSMLLGLGLLPLLSRRRIC
ncbi:cohesin domain-containing protein [Roseateles violae]|uniref:Cohesin domain-containing protein n=1 Tax=Roseateles violae TaxID=3058042 RepID=A0ABT8DVK9_9BURK|nr:cohesin domain-containing protein [Pelomonas sp. PFR6]MDN3922116.1 cohesin domain-containing protein [Pelomonas sp. PFR6]